MMTNKKNKTTSQLFSQNIYLLNCHPGAAINPTFPETCYLLTGLQDPIRECEGDPGNSTCATGLPNCEGSLCAFLGRDHP